jgi:hypothetical protein
MEKLDSFFRKLYLIVIITQPRTQAIFSYTWCHGHLLRKYPGIVWSRVSQNLGGNNNFLLAVAAPGEGGKVGGGGNAPPNYFLPPSKNVLVTQSD